MTGTVNNGGVRLQSAMKYICIVESNDSSEELTALFRPLKSKYNQNQITWAAQRSLSTQDTFL